jgi:hypothetical protein
MTYVECSVVADTPSIKLRYVSPWKGGTREWSNRMHFAGGTPPDATHWSTLAVAIRDEYKSMFTSDTTIVGAVGYGAGSDLPVWSTSWSTAGTYSPGTGLRTPLEVCALIRYSTDQRSVKNHPIYLYQYMHDVFVQDTGSRSLLLSGLQTGWTTRGNDWIAGYSDGTTTYHRAGPRGAVAQSCVVDTYVHIHEFPR